MNVTFTAGDDAHAPFLDACAAAGINGIKGHRSVGGFRASMYNALPLSSVEVLVDVMQEFEADPRLALPPQPMKVLANDGISAKAKAALEAEGIFVSTDHVEQAHLIDTLNREGYAGILVRSATWSVKDLIDACPDLRFIGRGGVGMDNIDVDYAREQGKVVFNTPPPAPRVWPSWSWPTCLPWPAPCARAMLPCPTECRRNSKP